MSAEAMGWVYKHSQTEGGTFAVHLAIADSANDMNNYEFWLSVPQLAAKARLGERQVQRILRDLCVAGYLEVVKASRGRVPSVYRFLMNGDMVSPLKAPSNGDTGDTVTVTSETNNGDMGVTDYKNPIEPNASNEGNGSAEPPVAEKKLSLIQGEGSEPTAAYFVGLYVDACKEFGSEPPDARKAQLGRAIKPLLKVKPVKVLEAAIQVIAEENRTPGHIDLVVGDIERELRRIAQGGA